MLDEHAVSQEAGYEAINVRPYSGAIRLSFQVEAIVLLAIRIALFPA
jgi:hypothetical protein